MTGTQPANPRGGQTSPGAPGRAHTQPAHDPPPFPKPDEPGENEPMHDPPVIPPRDKSADGAEQAGGVKAPDPSPDQVIFDANKIET